ncbi:MAG TPA: ABC transporter ATP-binding protein [Acidimicrobiales bacterium]|nr:ABC transporter ATP-binding protein [Acidimicrobiales bacterium]
MSDKLPLLTATGFTVSYGTVDAVQGIDLEIGEGETVALLGANGAGKTSTLRALSRLIRSSGEVVFDGRDTAKMAPDAVARAGLIHVPEGRHLFASLTAEENLLVGTTAANKREPIFSLDDIYDLFPALTPLRKRTAWALSGGEQQMVAIGRGLLSVPRLLLLDEPSLGLAPVVVDAVFKALAEIGHRTSILIVEQNASLALGLADRGYVLAVGKVVMAGVAADLADREALLASYLAREIDAVDTSAG